MYDPEETKRRWMLACARHLAVREPLMKQEDRETLAAALWERRGARAMGPITVSGYLRSEELTALRIALAAGHPAA